MKSTHVYEYTEPTSYCYGQHLGQRRVEDGFGDDDGAHTYTQTHAHPPIHTFIHTYTRLWRRAASHSSNPLTHLFLLFAGLSRNEKWSAVWCARRKPMESSFISSFPLMYPLARSCKRAQVCNRAYGRLCGYVRVCLSRCVSVCVAVCICVYVCASTCERSSCNLTPIDSIYAWPLG